MTPRRGFRTAVIGVLTCTACHWGNGRAVEALARVRTGAVGELLTTGNKRYRAELLAAPDSGLVVMTAAGSVAFVGNHAIASFRIDALGSEYALDRDGESQTGERSRLRLVSRFPQGLSASLLARLLEIRRQSSVELLR